MKEGSFERALKTIITMPLAGVSIILINKSWLDDYCDGDPEILTQVVVSKKLKQPIILMIDQDLTPPEKEQINRIFQAHTVVTKIIYDPNNLKKSEPEIKKALELYERKYVKKKKSNK
jgi:hypothetical protein